MNMKPFLEDIKQDIPIRALLLPILLSIGILLYYSLSFEPSWPQLLWCAPALLLLHRISKLLFFISFYCLLGACAFKMRVWSVNYKPCLVTSATIPIEGKVSDIVCSQMAKGETVCKVLLENLHHVAKQHVKTARFNEVDYTPALPQKAILSIDTSHFPILKLGQKIRCHVRFMPVGLPATPKEKDQRFFTYFQNIGSKGIIMDAPVVVGESSVPWIKRNRSYFASFLKEKLSHSSDLALAFAFGDKSGLKPSLLQQFSNTGLGHTLAVSGLHVSVVALFFFIAGKCLGIACVWLRGRFFSHDLVHTFSLSPRLFGKCASLLAVIYYVALSGMGFSALRASLMFTFGLILLYSQKHARMVFVLSAAGCVILLLMPESLFYASFQLSFIAVFGFTLAKFEKTRSVWHFIYKACLSTLFTTLLTTPIVLYHFQQFSLQPFLANLIVLPYIASIVIPCIYGACAFDALLGVYGPFCFLVDMQVPCLKWLIGYLSAFSWSLHTLPVHPWAVVVFGLSVVFYYSKTCLKYIAYSGTAVFACSLFWPPEKAVLLMDQYSRVGFEYGGILYTSFDPNLSTSGLLSRYKEYWGVDHAVCFNMPDKIRQGPCQTISTNRNTANVVCRVEQESLDWSFAWCGGKDAWKSEQSKRALAAFKPITLAFSNLSLEEKFAKYAKQIVTPASLAINGGIALYADGQISYFQTVSGNRPWNQLTHTLRTTVPKQVAGQKGS